MSSQNQQELDSTIEVLQSMLQKNLALEQNLKSSQRKISTRHQENVNTLESLKQCKEDLSQQMSNTQMSKMEKIQVEQLHGHRIQSIPFYQYEEFTRVDCAGVFELIKKKKRQSNQKASSDSNGEKQQANLTEQQQEVLGDFCKLCDKAKIKAQMKPVYAKLLVLMFLTKEYESQCATVAASIDVTNCAIDWSTFAQTVNTFKLSTTTSAAGSGIVPRVEGLDLFMAFKSLSISFKRVELKQILLGSLASPIASDTLRVIKKSVFDEVKTKKKPALLTSGLPWSVAEDSLLRRAVKVFGVHRWGQVATWINGREHSETVQRWNKQLNPSVEKGKWTLVEDIALTVAKDYFEQEQKGQCEEEQEEERSKSKIWCSIATILKNRVAMQIRERWCNLIDPKIKYTPWTKEEDERLLELAEKFQGGWAKISRHLESKTDNQVLRRWKLLLSDRFKAQAIENLFLKAPEIVKRNIFKPIKLSPSLAALVRSDNLRRKVKKAKKSDSDGKISSIQCVQKQKKMIAKSKVRLISSKKHYVIYSQETEEGSSTTYRADDSLSYETGNRYPRFQQNDDDEDNEQLGISRGSCNEWNRAEWMVV